MKPTAVFLLIAAAASLVACGKSDEAAAPAPEAAVAEAPAEAAAPAAETAVEPAPAEAPTPTPAPAVKAPAPAAVPAPTVADLVHGQKIYRQACAFCHDKGVAGAPKIGDVAAWSARIAQGMDTLYMAALNGKGAMPAKGGNLTLGEADVNAVVDFMVVQSR